MLEKNARSGYTRYIEYFLSHFGINSPDATKQRAEYLGGYKNPLNISAVSQTSSAVDTSALGNLAAFGETGIRQSLINKTFFITWLFDYCCLCKIWTFISARCWTVMNASVFVMMFI